MNLKKGSNLKNKETKYILSETFDEEKERYSYSLHPVECLYAKVKYACNLQ